MASMTGQQDLGTGDQAPAQNQTGESTGGRQRVAETESNQKSSVSTGGSGSEGKEEKKTGSQLDNLDGEAGETGGSIDKSFVQGVKDSVKK
ncbi:hypothetical protein LTR64_004606 [Lithohypha guttulata]|uniref:uncharacterized protein n=1 Tax=Lithohypha guttulata TaxID=1690604 RepID=UPI002DDDDCEB|nr:hypothetical protein LTR51_006096 [Lithohypha guttulata]